MTEWTDEPDDRGNYGYFVVRRGRPAGEQIEAGDPVDVYPIQEPFGFARFEALRADEARRAVEAAILPLTTEQIAGAASRVVNGLQPVDVQTRVFCPCSEKDRSTLVSVGVTDTGLSWAIVGRERVPAAFRTRDRGEGTKAFLLHPRISTHYQTTRCKHRQFWGVELAHTHLRILKLGTPKYGARVAP